MQASTDAALAALTSYTVAAAAGGADAMSEQPWAPHVARLASAVRAEAATTEGVDDGWAWAVYALMRASCQLSCAAVNLLAEAMPGCSAEERFAAIVTAAREMAA